MPMESTTVITGMEKQSQKETKRAAFLEPYTVRRPSSLLAWLATKPTVVPPILARAVTMDGAKSAPSSTISFMSAMRVSTSRTSSRP